MRTLADFYQEYVVELDPILWEMGRINGIHVDNPARLLLLKEMDEKIDRFQSESQQYVPEELFPIHRLTRRPDEDSKWSGRPIREVEVPNDKVKTCSNCGLQHVTKTEHTGRKGGRDGQPLNPCYKSPIILQPGTDIEYDIVLPFNPGSDDQLREYAQLYRHKLGRNWRTDQDTLDAKHVQKLINKHGDKHPIYQYALNVRKVRKARGYANAWVPDELGLLYGEYTHVPETFRLSQRRHNFQNVSHRGDVPYAEELRRLLVAPPGYVLIEADSASIEAVFTGKFMGSTSYMEMATKGIHATWALQTLGIPVTKENIKWLKNAPEHKILYDRKKRTVHGVSYGMGAKLLFESYPEYFKSRDEAQKEIDDFYQFVPELKAWHKEVRDWAHKHGYLQNPWGLRNYYYRIYTYNFKAKEWKLGEDAKAAIAFKPQSANGLFQRENLKLIHATIGKMGKRGKWFQTAIGQVHDSNGLRVPEDDQEKARDMLMEIMHRPIKEMGGIQIGVEVKSGKNWDAMKSIGSV